MVNHCGADSVIGLDKVTRLMPNDNANKKNGVSLEEAEFRDGSTDHWRAAT